MRLPANCRHRGRVTNSQLLLSFPCIARPQIATKSLRRFIRIPSAMTTTMYPRSLIDPLLRKIHPGFTIHNTRPFISLVRQLGYVLVFCNRLWGVFGDDDTGGGWCWRVCWCGVGRGAKRGRMACTHLLPDTLGVLLAVAGGLGWGGDGMGGDEKGCEAENEEGEFHLAGDWMKEDLEYWSVRFVIGVSISRGWKWWFGKVLNLRGGKRLRWLLF